jgi:hypothetical protein
MEDVVDRTIDHDEAADIMLQEAEALSSRQRRDVVGGPADEVVETDDLSPELQQAGAQVRAEETCPTGDYRAACLEVGRGQAQRPMPL